jgi:hypothetical protein
MPVVRRRYVGPEEMEVGGLDLREALAMHPAILSSPDDEMGEDTGVTPTMVETRRRLPPWPTLGPNDLEASHTTRWAPTSG